MSRFVCAVALILFCVSAFAQQEYVSKFDVYTGYAYLTSPAINLDERGFHTQIGYNPRTWLSMGFDYSAVTGRTTLFQKDLNSDAKAKLAPQLQQLLAAGLIPPTFVLAAPIDSTTQTYAAGPQLNYRHFRWATFSVHPSLGAMHETATPRTNLVDPVTAAIVKGLAPSGHKSDWTGFYGAGGTVDFNTTKHVGVRFTADYVWVHLFSDLLGPRTSLRISVGPSFKFGSNVAK